MAEQLKGLRANIFRANREDCSLDGISSRVDTVTVVGQYQSSDLLQHDIDEVFKASETAPAVVIRYRFVGNHNYIYAVPVELIGKRVAMGGTYIASSDSRFRAISGQPIPLHDRDMSKEWELSQQSNSFIGFDELTEDDR